MLIIQEMHHIEVQPNVQIHEHEYHTTSAQLASYIILFSFQSLYQSLGGLSPFRGKKICPSMEGHDSIFIQRLQIHKMKTTVLSTYTSNVDATKTTT